ncbi:AAA family ATPase [Streptomyces muensis]|uniref:AAA family ATPase n=1 Tax=Streptomyces muensis TaxID=1077944 RepID=A0A9X1TH56_STRM4|nr:AAA family ATPase [Streptomyces muensis]MCF1592406.1 AAA family ATPase [Streptomyces muensis]
MTPGPCVLLMAPSGAGKSTLAEQLARELGAAVVSYDAHQRRMPGDTGVEAVTEDALTAAWAELATHCAAGTPVVVDGTHSQPERRARVHAIATVHGRATILLVLMVPLTECLARQQSRARKVPAADVTRQHTAITAALPALDAEGHAAVIRLEDAELTDACRAALHAPRRLAR